MAAPTTATQPLPREVGRTPAGLRVLLTLAVIVVGLVGIASAAWTLLDLAARHEFTTTASYPGVRTLDLSNALGDVHIVKAPKGAPLTVRTHVTEGLASPRQSATRDAHGTLHLSASCTLTPIGNSSCDVGYTVAVPDGTHLRVSSPRGDIHLSDYVSRQPLKLTTSGGDIDLEGVKVPALELHSSGGDVQAQGIRGAHTIEASSSAGDVTMGVLTPARRLTVSSSAGDVDLSVPNVPYRVKMSNSGGDIHDAQLRQDPHSPYNITATSSAGDVNVVPNEG
jgi:hypothetical protein